MNASKFIMVDIMVLSILVCGALVKLADSMARLLEPTCLSWYPLMQEPEQ
jgi:hypothetical protein